MDGQRQQPYVPGPPPQTIQQTASQGHVMQLPPPPPQPPPPRVNHAASHGGLPPPPPVPPRVSGYGNQPGWQQAWSRQQGMGQSFYLPPPPSMLSSNQVYNQPLAYNPHQPPNSGSLSIQPPPTNDQPLTSATYIPGGSSFGPGVGIPPLDSYDNFSRADRAGYPPDSDTMRYIPQSYADQMNRSHQVPSSFREQSDSGNPLALNQNVHGQSSLQHSQGPTRENSSRHAASAISSGLSIHEADERWPLDRVLQWLVHNGFSTEWQETFKSLDLKGADFIDLGCGGANGMGNLGKMHQDIYPQLAKECVKSGTGWDQSREREEGVRMRKLIRGINSENAPSARFYENLHPSASTDGGVETSPHLRADSFPFDPSSTESGYQEPSSRSELSRNILVNAFGEWRRHSPSASSDHGAGLRASSNSRAGSPATQFASMATAEPAFLTGEFGHAKRNSSDSIISRGLRQAQGSSNPDHSTKQTELSTKDHKGFLNAIRKKIGPSHPSEEPHHDASISPVRNNQSFPYSGKPSLNASETSLVMGMSLPSSESHARKAISNLPPKKFIFVTLDGWNYRLVDVTDVDAADLLRARLCNGVGIKDPSSALIYVTEPGQVDHEEPLSDTMLVVNRRSRSDAQGSLKLYIQSMTPSAFNVSQYAGLGLSFSDRVANGAKPQRNILEDDTRNRTNQPSHTRRVSPSLAHRSSMQNLPSYSPFPEDDRLGENLSEDKERNAAILAAHEEHRRITEQKQQAFLQSRREQLQKKQASTVTTYGIKRGGFIDFDLPRTSPYEDKRTDDLVPRREPPTAPSASSTLTKVNSLNKKPGEKATDNTCHQRRSSKDFLSDNRQRSSSFSPKNASPSMGIAAAIANMGKISGSIAKPLASSTSFGHSPRTPSGSEFGRVSTESIDASSASPHCGSSSSPRPSAFARSVSANSELIARKSTPTQAESTPPDKSVHSFSASPSRASAIPPSRLSHGPDFDFQETEVSFVKSPQPAPQDSDEDSDEGLFAIPLANGKNKPQVNKKPPATRSRLAKPALTVNTNSRAAKGLSVTFESPGPCDSFTPLTDHSDSRSGHYSGDPDTDDLSPEDSRSARRRSFVRDDVWASRPPVEGMIEHLDDFFPNIDLDEPYLEAMPLTPPISPTATSSHPDTEPEQSFTLRDRVGQGGPPTTSIPRNASDTLGSDESTLKGKAAPKTVAHRNVGRSTGLSRMKSIREVAKGAHQIRRNQSIAASKNAQSGMLRRKSTKMFGARIMQISPKPGSRLSDLDPLPQHPVPQEKLPQRQATFRIIRGQLIGKGTYGRVYLGMNAETGEILAVKQVEVNQKAAGYDKDRIKEMVQAMDHEIDTMQHLEHPNIVQYLGCHRSELSMSIYLEYIPGGSIGSCLRKHGKFEESVVQSLTIQTLRGLAYLHDKGILHRDLKADNILLDLDGTCKISDFGISKKSDNIYGNDVTNSMQGSVFWMAPEVVQSQGQGYSAKVDIWSLGCVVLEMFAGRRPWSKEEAIGAIFKLGSLNQAPPIPEDVSMNICPAAIAFMYDCFTINTFDRPTAETLLSQHPFCIPDPNFNFLDTELHAKIGHL
ncbi:Protein kinase domain containing protein [Coccidioides posadasii C735 delta SOWgp]|uniref:Mitogen-activated protein kinase kinae kinase bck1 n=1 Tax=Coccidioides posadasii (strain C735) TaxID=222929 RepID=C5P9E2_COCP7|nr:Protein kinase domain containing protein [Coccidioides posadasii C735 delta SOWgp]EER26354.1 Protein kinase domain containing protein [Coccidioides posadasii C735 delta SOWgp]|eukprot:XP_003068499.1 Protein kinase domain containing protein [Coccidioides posadasii C735 delta SOWgp]